MELEEEVEEMLEKMIQDGMVEKLWIDGEFKYKLTEKGLKEARRRALK